jgi:hypothetical protein
MKRERKVPRGKKKKEEDEDENTPLLYPMPLRKADIKVPIPEHPIWTENKARLIERYLYYFIFITHHGSYIDGFAGPQSGGIPDSWSAKTST